MIAHHQDASPVNQSVPNGRLQRVLRLLMYLSSGMNSDSAQLGKQLGVSRRTIFRDIALLRDSGLPVVFDEASRRYSIKSAAIEPGGYGLDVEECMWLFACVRMSHFSAWPEVAQIAERACAKIACTLPVSEREQLAGLLATDVFKPNAAANNVAPREILQAIVQGMLQRRQLKVVLRELDGESRSTMLAPYQLVVSNDCWQIRGRLSAPHAIELIDLRKFEQVDISSDVFAMPHHC